MSNANIAYFSMEIALEPAMPTYAGGLGVLAGDTIRSAADMSLPMVAVTLVHRQGYLRQQFDPTGWQRELPAAWNLESFLHELPARVSVPVESRLVQLRAWQREVQGVSGSVVPVLFLDSDLPENNP